MVESGGEKCPNLRVEKKSNSWEEGTREGEKGSSQLGRRDTPKSETANWLSSGEPLGVPACTQGGVLLDAPSPEPGCWISALQHSPVYPLSPAVLCSAQPTQPHRRPWGLSLFCSCRTGETRTPSVVMPAAPTPLSSKTSCSQHLNYRFPGNCCFTASKYIA